MRDDSTLYTGQTSASFSVKEQPIRTRKREEKKEQRITLTPAADWIAAELQREIDQLKDIDYLQVEDMLTDEHFKAEMMARKKTIEKLRAVKTRLTNTMRTNGRTPDPEA